MSVLRLISFLVPRQIELLQQYVESQGDNPYQKAQIDKDATSLKRLLPELQTVCLFT